ncbi:hypothetical protein [Photobacterium carnosum]|jgi:hypothetical protein|uniref:hypothetical protein n=1 Tax=Photobacterium carnosum TaxID=2023717 RepID=UPI001C92486D|nr:hypothetical protein [Photobacterium carnosum]MBY3789863.1 hypothetical protein [Photobacterium carnosum]MCD9498309.1 hypothetical protein [Photobacterium carnosum]MCD9515956.1 hypothetical protein [Photobacterium carnosum]MCD9524005.1 hypothetical protein [Photobacterium carnosum]MCD9531384.1 hypothetical protein [Photobacterium carnosum]
MCYKQPINQVTTWINVLTSTNVPIKSVALLINNSPVQNLFIEQFNLLNIKTYQLIKKADPDLFINQILNSDCNILLVDKSSYPLLRQLIPSYAQHDIFIVLIQEPWMPDWTWTFTQCHFLCQSDLPSMIA